MKKAIIILVIVSLIAASVFFWQKYQKKNRIINPLPPENDNEEKKEEKNDEEKPLNIKKTIKYNPLVEALQKSTNNVLKINGLKLITVDGIYGSETEKGVRKALELNNTTPEKIMFATNQGKAVNMNMAAVFVKINDYIKKLVS